MAAANRPPGPPAHRSLPPGGGGRLRRLYVVMAVVIGAMLVGSSVVLVASLSSVSRGQRFLLPAVPASAGAAVALLVLAAGALTAASALDGDTADVAVLGRASRLALAGQLATVTAGLVAVGFGAVLAVNDRPSALWIALGVGGPAVALSAIGSSLRRLIRQCAG